MKILPSSTRFAYLTAYVFPLLFLISGLSFILYKIYLDPGVAFLTSEGQARWIAKKKVFHYLIKGKGEAVVFRKKFRLQNTEVSFKVAIRSLGIFQLYINDHKINHPLPRNWKVPLRIKINHHLKKGENNLDIVIVNPNGPAILWLQSDVEQQQISTGAGWQVRFLNQGPFTDAVPVDQIFSTRGTDKTVYRLARQSLPAFILVCILAFGIVCLIFYAGKKKEIFRLTPERLMLIVFAVLLLLFLSNLLKMKGLFGFDIRGHMGYVKYLSEFKTLPLANQGWQMYQPPLFYVLAVFIAKLFAAFGAVENTTLPLHIVPFLCCLGQVYIAFLTARLLFPDAHGKQGFVVATASLVPMNIYISHYISNESLVGLMINLTIYLLIKIMMSSQLRSASLVGLGLCLGLSLLTKFTAILLLPLVILGLFYAAHPFPHQLLKQLSRSFILVYGTGFILSGWFYLRNWLNFGKYFVSNRDPAAGFFWWQDPGFRISSFFTDFGNLFSKPLRMGEFAFWDFVYGTFWGDACFGGRVGLQVAPPWNYEFMSLVYYLALPMAFVFFLGIFQALHEPEPPLKAVYGLLLSQVIVFGLSLVYYALELPTYSSVKSFFVMCLILPFSIFSGHGFDLIERKCLARISSHSLIITRTYVAILFVTVLASIYII